MDNDSRNFVKVENPFAANLTISQQQEVFKNINTSSLMQDMIPDSVKNSKTLYDNIPKSNPVIAELKAVKSELQTQTTELDRIRYQNEKLNSQLRTANITIDEQKSELDKANELNEQQNKELISLRNQLHESKSSKVIKGIGNFFAGILGGVILAFILYFIGKYLGISL